jgi:GNAT superfamily N-acetyltransferase
VGAAAGLRLVEVASLEDPAAAGLMAGLAREYADRYGQDDELSTIAPTQPEVIVLLRRGEETVAGGALLAFAPGVGELKRMWTAPSERRRGHARRVLAALEDAARARGYRAVRLETGRPQPEAVALYAGAGYAPITPYGRYRRSPLVRCFEKAL